MSLRLFALLAAFTYLTRKDTAYAYTATVNPYQVPAQLWSPLLAQKVNATAYAVSSTQYPQYTDRSGGWWVDYGTDYWTSGFLPVELYAMQTREELCPSLKSGVDWLALGRAWSGGLTQLEVHTTVGHDVGFISMPFVSELQRNPFNVTAESAVKAFAVALANRYSSVVGCTRSWDSSDPTSFQVIIDNMMNLDIFFTMEALTGNHTYRNMATSHADKTLVNHLRPDYGSYHVVTYNSTNGKVVKRATSQGYADNSTWSRGQAWGVYGFANMHKHTLNLTYLDTARRMGQYFLGRTPADGVVPWDFDAPLTQNGVPRPADTSAAMIAANGMLLLAHQEDVIGNATGRAWWAAQAMNLYYNNVQFAWKPEWTSLLANGTVNNPAKNNLTGIIYGDYYMIQGGNTMLQMGLTQCPS